MPCAADRAAFYALKAPELHPEEKTFLALRAVKVRTLQMNGALSRFQLPAPFLFGFDQLTTTRAWRYLLFSQVRVKGSFSVILSELFLGNTLYN